MIQSPPVLAIVVPCYNEQEVFLSTERQLRTLIERMEGEKTVALGSFVVYVDDGSKDSTWELISEAAAKYPGIVKGVKLGHNAGHQNALLSGLEAVKDMCDAAITIDADLQDDIEAIPRMVEEYEKGNEIVYGVRDSRETDTWFKRTTAHCFYRLMTRIGVESIDNHADFRLMSQRAVKELLRYKEDNIFLRGVVARIGLRHSQVKYDRKRREAGTSKYPLRKMLNFSISGITSFSIAPVRMVFSLGILFMIVAFCIFVYVICRYITHQVIVGWSSLILSIWFCTGVLLISLGIIGEYVGKIFLEVKERPRYVVEKKIGFEL